MGKIDSTIIKEYGDKATQDQLVRINGIRVYKEFIAKGKSSAEAFQKTLEDICFKEITTNYIFCCRLKNCKVQSHLTPKEKRCKRYF